MNSYEKTPAPGDVITYQLGEVNVTHRVKKQNEDGTYETKGDANELSDAEYVSEEQILGTVCGTVPYLGYLVMQLRSGQGIQILIFLFLVYVCAEYLEERNQEERRAGKNTCGK